MPLTCKVIRSKRRTIALQVYRDGSVVVRAPLFTMNFQIKMFVKKMQSWIEKQQKKFSQAPKIPQLRAVSSRKFESGMQLLFRGKKYTLDLVITPKIAQGSAKMRGFVKLQKADIRLTDDKFAIVAPTITKAKALLEAWYKKEARRVFTERLDFYAATFQTPYETLKLSSARTRWGSCSRRRNINLNWKLIMSPPEIADYVIAHELSHTQHMNHSPKFWAHVETMMPEHKKHKKWLKDFGKQLKI